MNKQLLLAAAVAAGWVAPGCSATQDRAPATAIAAAGSTANPADAADPKRGEYLVRFGACILCHTPWAVNPETGVPAPDPKRLLSGHPENGPEPKGTYAPGDVMVVGPTFTSFRTAMGTVYSANLTPDKDTGTGTWTPEMFIRIFRTGRHLGAPDARPIVPPMPWQNLQHLTDDDLRAIFAFLQSLPPIRNQVPEHQIPEATLARMKAAADAAAAKAASQPPPAKK